MDRLHSCRNILWAAFLIGFLSLLIEPQPACSAPRRTADLTLTQYGTSFVGGKAPKILSLTPVKEFKAGSGYYYYSYKAMVRRSSGDANGSMVLFKARTYGDAVAQLLGIRPSSKKVFDLFFPVSLDKSRFPSVLMLYKYKIRIRGLGSSTAGFSTGHKEARGPHRFVEYLSLGMLPGTYEVQVQTEVELGPHPIRTLYDVIEWGFVILDLEGAVADKITEYSEWFTASGLAKKARILANYSLADYEEIFAYGDTPEDFAMLALATTKIYRWDEAPP